MIDLNRISEVKLVYRNSIPAQERPVVTRAPDVYSLFIKNWDPDLLELVEEAKIMLLNRANRCLGICNLSRGGTSHCVVDPKQVFMTALKANASQIIVAHNHPSGNLKPSNADIQLTRKLFNGGRILDIEVLDHLIVARDGYFSMANEGCFPI